MHFDQSSKIRMKSQALIPGGCHTYAKGDDQYPVNSPGFIARGQGCIVWDADGNRFIEYGMGLRSVTLGHGYEPVLKAAYEQMLRGTNFTRPSVIEVQCAEALLELLPRGEMVKFAKNGSDATTAAVKLSRAYTGRDMVAICGDHPFFSTDDWFIGSTPMAAGIPAVIRDLTVKFRYNDMNSLHSLFQEHKGKIACVVMEAETITEPIGTYLHEVQQLCRKEGALFILDEMITGFRWHLGGAQQYYDVDPDLSTFGKGIANGFSVAALVGKREIMELGGLDHQKEKVFLLSTTHGAETHALAAAMQTIEIYKQQNVIEHLWRKGKVLSDRLNTLSREMGLFDHFRVIGRPCNLVYMTKDREGNPSQEFRALLLQETIKQGLLMPSLVISYSHTDDEIDKTVKGVQSALKVYQQALNDGVDTYLVGRPVKPVFRQYN